MEQPFVTSGIVTEAATSRVQTYHHHSSSIIQLNRSIRLASIPASHWCLGSHWTLLSARTHTHTRTPACTQVRFQFKGCSQSLSKLDKAILSSLHLLSDTSLVDNTDICCTPHHSWCACSRLESKRSHSRDLASSWWRSIKESRSQGWVQDGFFRIHRGQSASCLSWISDDLCCALGPPHHHWR